MAARLLVALGAAIAGGAGHAVFTGALAARLVAGLAARSHRMAVAGWRERNQINKINVNDILATHCIIAEFQKVGTYFLN